LKKSLVALIVLFLNIHFSYSQERFTLKGEVLESDTDYKLIGANVYFEDMKHGTLCDIDGKFELESEQAFPWELTISYIGYKDKKIIVNKEDGFQKIYLDEDLFPTNKVIICPIPPNYQTALQNIKGNIIDQEPQKPLKGVSIPLEDTGLNTRNNKKGNLKLVIPEGEVSKTIVISFLGYKEKITKDISANTQLKIKTTLGVIDGEVYLVPKKKFPGLFKKKNHTCS